MGKNSIKFSRISLLFILTISILADIALFANAQQEEDKENVLMIDKLNDEEIVWEVLNATGIFSDSSVIGYEGFSDVGDLAKMKVTEVNAKKEKYYVDVSYKPWWGTEFVNVDDNDYHSGCFIVPRDWKQAGLDYGLYWTGEKKAEEAMTITYHSQWWSINTSRWTNINLINVVKISITLNETNYDEMIYSQAEGILLSRDIRVNAADGKYRGMYSIRIRRYSGILSQSPWYYVIISLTLFGLILTVIIIISILIQRRKRIYREIDEL
ncbi:MAG: hypothetical protein ACTSQJ_03270 [Promethearchaeota archaeon]